MTSTVKCCHVVCDQWDELLQSVQKFVRCQIPHCRTRRGGKTSFLLLGEPRFSNPLKQQQEGGALICLEEEQGRRMARSLVRKLKVDIKNSAQRILQLRDHRRVTANNTRAGNGNANQGDDENELETAAVIDLVSDDLNEKIEHANALDSDRRPRLSRTDAKVIPVHNRKAADEKARQMIVATALVWGWCDPCNTHRRRLFVADAVCKQVAHDLGCCGKSAMTQLPNWCAELNESINDGEVIDPLSPSCCGGEKHVDSIETEHPGHLHELFWHAQSTMGPLASFFELVTLMNEKSASPREDRKTLSPSKWQLQKWFENQGGKKCSSISKPLLTDEHKTERVRWARQVVGFVL